MSCCCFDNGIRQTSKKRRQWHTLKSRGFETVLDTKKVKTESCWAYAVL